MERDPNKLSRREAIAAGITGSAAVGAGLAAAPAQAEEAAGFKGRIAPVMSASTPDIRQEAVPAAGSPNVLLVILDDVGFADLGCYGGEIPTPNIDRLAASGLRYTNFRTTGVCSATRASVMTGLNPHSAGIGWLTFSDSGYPGYRGDLAENAATMAERFSDAGYCAYHVGKWHVNLADTTNAAGPTRNWPSQRGYARSYWFQGHSTDYFAPAQLYAGNERITPPVDGYYATDDFTDRALAFLRDHRAQRGDRPFLMTLAHPGTHSPLQARREDIARFKGAYDAGWDVLRAARLDRQKAMGLVPANAALPPANPGVPRWDTLDPAQRRVQARYMEVYAAMIARIDEGVGRILDALEALGDRDNTIIALMSDNGGSPDGRGGTPNLLAMVNGGVTPAETAERIDAIGGPDSYPMYSLGWASVSNTPFRLYKHDTHLGGVADPLILSWPRTIPARGELRGQFLHAVDLLPTLLDAAGIPARSDRPGAKPIEGRSARSSFADRDAPDPRDRQYFEMGGLRAMRLGRWRIVSKGRFGLPGDAWELYDTATDPNETRDLAAERPDIVERLDRAWTKEAQAHQVFPIDDRSLLERSFAELFRGGGKDRWSIIPPIDLIPEESSPKLLGRDFEIELTLADAGRQGVLFAHGNQFLGAVAFVREGRVWFEFRCDPHLIALDAPWPSTVRNVRFVQRLSARPRVGRLSIVVDGREAAALDSDRLLLGTPMQGLQIGRNESVRASPRYAAPFAFDGRIERVEIRTDNKPYDAGEIAAASRAYAAPARKD
ncbi:sulfatase-like hydrolase/transferase [Sphingomonas histidinilytica]|uniref:arylsulfatase n=1 Tax=Rhizorhabdus histidinilytica TaxID=439228 RepID=UPI001ADD0B2C|nr:arylsulfatase [Rhizorhabdus histidinilytica]MBO9377235.1 sulfatase-like hydrolase/transferase [Rhizorhabdus histidinilytica]